MTKILITGGTGFVGANFVRYFANKADVHLLVRPESKMWRIEDIQDKIKFWNTNLLDESALRQFIGKLRPDIILHFATYGAYQGREQNAKLTVETNVLGAVNLMNTCAETGFGCFINTGSSSEYGEKAEPMREDMFLEPNNLYGVTKAAAASYAVLLARKNGLPIISTRLFSVYGYFEDKNRLIPSLITAYLQGRAPNLTSPSSVRDFIFIEDVIAAYERIIDRAKDLGGSILNIGTGTQSTVGDVATLIRKISGSNKEPVYGSVRPNQNEPPSWAADMSQTLQALGWSAQTSLPEGLKKNIAWFKDVLASKNWYS